MYDPAGGAWSGFGEATAWPRVVAYVPVDFLIRKLNEFAPALTLLLLIVGFVWTAATRNAQFEVVTRDLAELATDVEALQTDVRSVQETLPHVVSCVIDLQRFTGSWENTLRAGDPPSPLPASCEHALARTTPAQGD